MTIRRMSALLEELQPIAAPIPKADTRYRIRLFVFERMFISSFCNGHDLDGRRTRACVCFYPRENVPPQSFSSDASTGKGSTTTEKGCQAIALRLARESAGSE